MSASFHNIAKLIAVLIIEYSLIAQVSCLGGTFQVLVQQFQFSIRTNDSSCPNYFRVCLGHLQVHVAMGRCTYGQANSSIFDPNAADDTVSAAGNFSSLVNVSFAFAWPGTYSLVIEARCSASEDSGTTYPDEIYLQVVTNGSLYPSDQWSEGFFESSSGQQQQQLLEYGLRVVCLENNYGPDCSVFCSGRDDVFGHYTCDDDGSKVCLAGWDDPDNYCLTAICLTDCNNGNGSCVGPNQCRCLPGWSGSFCDECAAGLGCSSDHGSCQLPGQCNCADGWGGIYCDKDLQFCTNHKPCKNGSTCINSGPDGYQCLCQSGYTGPTCLIAINECSFQPCYNGGTCLTTDVGYLCNCETEFTGDECQSEIGDCQPTPCLNGATCIDELEGFRCLCSTGFDGFLCGDDSDDCRPTPPQQGPCLNGATCIDGPNEYRCVCAPGFSGNNCQDDGISNGTGNATVAVGAGAGAAIATQHLLLVALLGAGIPLTVILLTACIMVVIIGRRRSRDPSSPAAADDGASGPSGGAAAAANTDNIRNNLRDLNNYRHDQDDLKEVEVDGGKKGCLPSSSSFSPSSSRVKLSNLAAVDSNNYYRNSIRRCSRCPGSRPHHIHACASVVSGKKNSAHAQESSLSSLDGKERFYDDQDDDFRFKNPNWTENVASDKMYEKEDVLKNYACACACAGRRSGDVFSVNRSLDRFHVEAAAAAAADAVPAGTSSSSSSSSYDFADDDEEVKRSKRHNDISRQSQENMFSEPRCNDCCGGSGSDSSAASSSLAIYSTACCTPTVDGGGEDEKSMEINSLHSSSSLAKTTDKKNNSQSTLV